MTDYPSPWVFLILCLASARAVHLVLWDSIIGTHPDSQTKLAERIQVWAWDPAKQARTRWRGFWGKLGTCWYCLSGWVTLAATCVAGACWPWQLAGVGLLTWGAAWSVACVLLALDFRYLVD